MSSTTSCLRCGHPFDGSREVERLLGHTIKDVPALGIQQEGDVAAIQVEVRLLDDLIRRLNQNRARLLQKVNNLQAKTRRLPPEVLSTIFQLAHPPIDVGTRSIPAEFRKDLRRYAFTEEEEEEEGEEFQLVLGAVSHHWRQVAWATPQLWTTISIEAHETVGESNVSLLSLYFENSRNLPMTVVLDFRDQLELMMDRKRKEPSWFIKSLEDLFRDNAAKIRNFTMTGIPIEWTHLIRESFSRCESMTLYWSSSFTNQRFEGTHLLDLAQLPSLLHLRLKNLRTPFTLPWSTITTLQLDGVPIERCVQSLAKCPNLIKFENDYQSRPSQDSSALLNHTVVLAHLESLTWYAHDSAWSSAFLCHMRFSRLRVLKWSVRPLVLPFSEQFENNLITFFSSLPETLRVLELYDVGYGYQIMKPLLAGIPHLAELILRHCAFGTFSMAISMVGRPAAGIIEDTMGHRAFVDPNQSEGPKILPCLRKLTMFFGYRPFRLEVYVEMLEALHIARVVQEPFHLELVAGLGHDTWDFEILAKLKRLAESGFKFEVTLNSQPLDFMSPLIDVPLLPQCDQ